MSCLGVQVVLQDLPFIDNRHLGSIPRFQRCPCSKYNGS